MIKHASNALHNPLPKDPLLGNLERGVLSVTVYKKGAEAVLDYITNHTTSKTMSTKSAKNIMSEELTIQAVNNQGVTVRIKIEPIGTGVCHTLRGKWHTDEIYNQSLPELIAEGVFTIENDKSQKAYAKYFNITKKDKRRAKRKAKKKARVAVIEEAPQVKPAEINEEVKSALWQEIEDAREAEQDDPEAFTDEPIIERGTIVRIKPEWLNPGESGQMHYVVVKEYDENRILIQALGTGLPLAPTEAVEKSMVNPCGYVTLND